MADQTSRREFVRTLSMAGAAAVAGGVVGYAVKASSTGDGPGPRELGVRVGENGSIVIEDRMVAALDLASNGHAKGVYRAIRESKFRLVFRDKVVCSRPRGQTDPRVSDPVYEDRDMKWDKNGCLLIKNPNLGSAIASAHGSGRFMIIVDSSSTGEPDPRDPTGKKGDGRGENKANAMCTC